jgi:hypothetical protein
VKLQNVIFHISFNLEQIILGKKLTRLFFGKKHYFTGGLMLRGYGESRLGSSFSGFCGRCSSLVCGYKLSLAHVLSDLVRTVC